MPYMLAYEQEKQTRVLPEGACSACCTHTHTKKKNMFRISRFRCGGIVNQGTSNVYLRRSVQPLSYIIKRFPCTGTAATGNGHAPRTRARMYVLCMLPTVLGTHMILVSAIDDKPAAALRVTVHIAAAAALGEYVHVQIT